MTKKDLVDVIGRLIVDAEFRTKYFDDKNEALREYTKLTPPEKEFLDTNENSIREYANKLNIKYGAEGKRS
jgi:hypothetical protein